MQRELFSKKDNKLTQEIKKKQNSFAKGINEDLGLCLTPDSLIELADGTKKPLVEIKAGDLVVSLNQETGKFEPHQVQALLDMGIKPVYKITTQSGKSLKTTLNHPYLTESGWKKLKDIGVGEDVAVMGNLSRPDSDSVFFKNKEPSFNFRWAKIVKKVKNAINNFFSAQVFNINNHNPGRTFNIESCNISEVLVKGQQNTVMNKDIIENDSIGGANKFSIINRDNLKPLISQGGNNIPVNALVNKNGHKGKLGLHDYLGRVLHKLRGVFNSGKDIFCIDAGILFGNLFYSVASAQQVEDIAYRNAGSFNTGFSKSDSRINYNSFFMHNNLPPFQKIPQFLIPVKPI